MVPFGLVVNSSAAAGLVHSQQIGKCVADRIALRLRSRLWPWRRGGERFQIRQIVWVHDVSRMRSAGPGIFASSSNWLRSHFQSFRFLEKTSPAEHPPVIGYVGFSGDDPGDPIDMGEQGQNDAEQPAEVATLVPSPRSGMIPPLPSR